MSPRMKNDDQLSFSTSEKAASNLFSFNVYTISKVTSSASVGQDLFTWQKRSASRGSRSLLPDLNCKINV